MTGEKAPPGAMPSNNAGAGGGTRPSRSAAWSLADQAVVSGGNFLTNIALARLTTPEVYGRFALYLAAMLVMNSVHAALVVYPLSIGVPTEVVERKRRALVTHSLCMTAAFCGVLAICLVPILSLFQAPWPGAPWLKAMEVSALAFAAVFAWQAQETCRRALIAGLRFPAVILGDFISFPGQAVLIYSLARRRHGLSLPEIFGCMIATSVLATVLQTIPLRPLFSVRGIGNDVKNFWRLGRWGSAGALLTAASTQGIFGVLGFLSGTSAVAGLQSVSNITGLTHPVMFGISNVVVPAVARSNAGGGSRRATGTGARLGLHGAALLVPYLIAILFFPAYALGLFYGSHSAYLSLTGPLRLMCCSYIVLYVGQILSSVLNGLGHPRLSFNGQRIAAVLRVAVGYPLAVLGLGSAVAGLLLANAGQAVSQFVSLKTILKESQ